MSKRYFGNLREMSRETLFVQESSFALMCQYASNVLNARNEHPFVSFRFKSKGYGEDRFSFLEVRVVFHGTTWSVDIVMEEGESPSRGILALRDRHVFYDDMRPSIFCDESVPYPSPEPENVVEELLEKNAKLAIDFMEELTGSNDHAPGLWWMHLRILFGRSGDSGSPHLSARLHTVRENPYTSCMELWCIDEGNEEAQRLLTKAEESFPSCAYSAPNYKELTQAAMTLQGIPFQLNSPKTQMV